MRDRLRLQAALAGVVTLGWSAATGYVMVNQRLASSIRLLQFVSFYAIVLSHAIIWREFRGELRTRTVERKQDEGDVPPTN